VTGDFQNNIDDLPGLGDYRFENIFKVHKTSDDYYYYNILKTVHVPEAISNSLCYRYRVDRKMALTALSYKTYKTIQLWWLICIVNNIDDPTSFIKPGTVIKLVKPSFVSNIISEINSQLN
tara:strand:- start:91 stop:453 length:363 start_codon:yes stop_codon:yes gene_type:complete